MHFPCVYIFEPSLPSVTCVWIGAEWPEREVYDMFGVRFEGPRTGQSGDFVMNDAGDFSPLLQGAICHSAHQACTTGAISQLQATICDGCAHPARALQVIRVDFIR